jgi:CheY-like chemotaxis protein
VRIPLDRPDEPARDADALVEDSGPLQRLNHLEILVLEDDPEAAEMLRRVLTEHGASVRVTATVAAARQALRESTPHLAISDIGLPGEDGYAFVNEVRRREREAGNAHLPIVALTAFGRPEDVEVALAAGFDAHMAKPVFAHRLIGLVAKLTTPAG